MLPGITRLNGPHRHCHLREAVDEGEEVAAGDGCWAGGPSSVLAGQHPRSVYRWIEWNRWGLEWMCPERS